MGFANADGVVGQVDVAVITFQAAVSFAREAGENELTEDCVGQVSKLLFERRGGLTFGHFRDGGEVLFVVVRLWMKVKRCCCRDGSLGWPGHLLALRVDLIRPGTHSHSSWMGISRLYILSGWEHDSTSSLDGILHLLWVWLHFNPISAV